MRDIVIDIETLGVEAGCPVLSIAALAFDRNDIAAKITLLTENKKTFSEDLLYIEYAKELKEAADQIYVKLPLLASLAMGCTINKNTAAWWNDKKRSDNLDVLLTGDLQAPLIEFNNWLSAFSDKDTCYWAKSPSFDMVILRDLYKKLGLSLNIDFRQERDIRTIQDWYRVEFNMGALGLSAHNPIDDCVVQALVAMKATVILEHLVRF